MVCSAASASSRAGLAASSFSSAITLSAYNINTTRQSPCLPTISTQHVNHLVCLQYQPTRQFKYVVKYLCYFAHTYCMYTQPFNGYFSGLPGLASCPKGLDDSFTDRVLANALDANVVCVHKNPKSVLLVH